MSPSDSSLEKESNGKDPGVSVDSLGEALAGVTIGSGQTSSNYGSSGIANSPFALAPGASSASNLSPSRDGSNQGTDDGWGNFSRTSGTLSSGTLSDRKEENPKPQDSLARNDGIDLFLSQSPSRALGDEVFKFNSHTNLPSLAEEGKQIDHSYGMPGKSIVPSLSGGSTNGGSFADIRSQDQNHRRRTESPACSVTGTTTSSRSVSPYTNASSDHGSRSIPTFSRYENASVGGNSNASSIQNAQASAMTNIGAESRAPVTRYPSGSSLPGIPNGTDAPPALSQTVFSQPLSLDPSQIPSLPPGAPSGQILYMAVPSPDGRGQVLQPVQMMQLPGKPYTYVVPGCGVVSQHGIGTDPSIIGMPSSALGQDYGGAIASDSGPRGNRAMANQYSVDTHSGERGIGDNRSRVNDYNSPKANQYQPDPAIASLYAAPQRPPLEALLGQIRRLSRDQVGCRLVQQALDEEGPNAASLILQEGLSFWGEAMVDPFGNYLFQKILEKAAPAERVMLIKSVSARLVNASLNLHGTRSVQKIVEVCAQDELDGYKGDESGASILTSSLAPAAARLCIDSHGNHVIQRILLRLGPMHSQFIFDAVAVSVGDVARHRHGCCVIQRCLDSPQSQARSHLVRCIVDKALELMQDAYGNYVVQYVLDVCSDEDVQAVCDGVVGKVNLLAIQKFSSNVMEKCLERCTDRTKELYLLEVSDPDRIRELMMDPFGNYVVQRALSVATHSQAVRLVEAMRPHLVAQSGGPNGQRNGGVRNTAGGRRIIAKICRRFPNFTLNPVGTQEELYSQNHKNPHQNHHPRYMSHHLQGNHLQNKHHTPMIASYASVPGVQDYPPGMAPYPPEHLMPPPMGPSHQPQQHFGFSNTGTPPNATTYYDPFNGGGHAGYPQGM